MVLAVFYSLFENRSKEVTGIQIYRYTRTGWCVAAVGRETLELIVATSSARS